MFVDLEKAYDKVPREEVWYCMRKSGLYLALVLFIRSIFEVFLGWSRDLQLSIFPSIGYLVVALL